MASKTFSTNAAPLTDVILHHDVLDLFEETNYLEFVISGDEKDFDLDVIFDVLEDYKVDCGYEPIDDTYTFVCESLPSLVRFLAWCRQHDVTEVLDNDGSGTFEIA